MTKRQQQFNTDLVRLTLIQELMRSGEKKISKAQSRVISPALVDIVNRDPMMMRACDHLGIDVNKLVSEATKIGFLKNGQVMIEESSDDSSEGKEVAHD